MGNLLSGLLGAAAGFATGGPVGAAVGGLGALTAKNSSGKASKADAAAAKASQQRLAQIGDLLQQRYATAAPGERGVLDYFMQRAGLSPALMGSGFGGALGAGHGVGMGTAPGINHGAPFAAYGSRSTLPGFQPVAGAAGAPGQPGLVHGSLGIYDSPEYQLLRQRAEQDIGHQMQNSQLGFNAQLANRGIDRSSIQAGGQAAITAGANQSYADFARNLAMQAADKQDALVGQYNTALQPALNSAGQAGSLYAGAGGLAQSGQQMNMNQGNTEQSALGTAIGAAAKYWQLGQHPKVAPAAGTYAPGAKTPGPWAARAQGGPVQAGHEYLVGEGGGPETFVPDSAKPTSNDKVSIPAEFLGQILAHFMKQSGQAVDHAARGYTNSPLGQFAISAWNHPDINETLPPLSGVHPQDRHGMDPDPYTQAVNALIARLQHRSGQGWDRYWGGPVPLGGDQGLYSMTLGSPEMLPARAGGGPVFAGQPTLIGEGGPEVIVPKQDGMVIPNPATPAVAPNHPLFDYLQALSHLRGC
jgi:hypothetical protein